MVVVNSRGQVVIPVKIREKLKIKAGTRLALYVESNRLTLQPITDEFIRSLVGCCKGKGSLVAAREREHKRDDRARDKKLAAMLR